MKFGVFGDIHSNLEALEAVLEDMQAQAVVQMICIGDIVGYNADIIPVGKDQQQHVEVARDIAIKFNNTFGQTFVVPAAEINQDTAALPGLDGQKMSKSYDNTIDIFMDEKPLRKRVMSIVTDSTPVDQPKNPDTCNLFALYKLFADQEEVEALRQRYLAPGLRYGDVKQELFERIRDFFAPYKAEREKLLADPGHLRRVLDFGADKARSVIGPIMDDVRKKVGIAY